MIGLGLVGAGRMGLSHLAIAGAHPSIEIVAVCESAGPVLSALRSYKTYHCLKSYERLLELDGLDAVLIATPTSSHEPMVRAALEKGLHLVGRRGPAGLTYRIEQQRSTDGESRRSQR